MHTPEQLLAAVALHQEQIPADARPRWALLVTFEELDALVDHLESTPSLGLSLDKEHIIHIKEGRAMLHINGTPVLPELMEAPAGEYRSN